MLWRSTSGMWKSLVKRMDFLYVSGNHLELRDEIRGKTCGSMMMTTAAMKYQSSFSTFYLQPVRSRPQERLVESLKQGLVIWMLSSPGKNSNVFRSMLGQRIYTYQVNKENIFGCLFLFNN